VAELGFGTGLNALATLKAWDQKGGFRFTSFEAFPMAATDMARALKHWPTLQIAPLIEAWNKGLRHIQIGPMCLEVIEGCVTETLPQWEGLADAWYLDGFSPAKNDAMWTADVMRQVGKHTQIGGTCATYSAATRIRTRLENAGFEVTRTKGYGHKRHMTRGVK